MRRRKFLIGSIGFGVGGSSTLGTRAVRADHEDHGSITFQDQSTDGQTIVIDQIKTEINANLAVRNIDTDANLYYSDIEKGEYDDYEVDLTDPLSESAELAASLHDQDGHGFARDTAFVEVTGGTEFAGFSTTLIDANPDAGFNYPYFLYAPWRPKSGEDVPILVEPNNTGTATDDFERHKAAARELIQDGGISRRTAENLGAPFLVPVFPRPESEPVDSLHLVHQLDDDTMEIEEGPLERVDLQLLNMVEHARAFLKDRDYPVDESGIMLNGFSASGNFVDRFTVMHPEEVISVAAGGLNGMVLLPLEELNGRQLPYHVGIANVEELIGKQPDLEALSNTNQFLFMGAEDGNDTIPYKDAWTDEELRQLALDVYGEDMIGERFPRCQEAYRKANIEAQFRIYPDVGHQPGPAREDIPEFHKRTLAGEDVSDFGQDIVPNPKFSISDSNPTLNDRVEFDASGTDPAHQQVLLYAWDFDDNETEIGEMVTHSFDVAGTYEIELTVVFQDGTKKSTSQELVVTNAQDSTPTVNFTMSTSNPTTADEVEFDASGTDSANKQALVFAWDFGDGETETGITVTHSFNDSGTYEIQLTVTFGDGSQIPASRQLMVSEETVTEPPSTDTRTNEETKSITSTETSQPSSTETSQPGSTETSQPGFGIVSALAGLGGGAYLLRGQIEDQDQDE